MSKEQFKGISIWLVLALWLVVCDNFIDHTPHHDKMKNYIVETN